MPVIARRFGAFKGVSGQDLRVILTGPGQKNALVLIAAYQRDTLAASDETTFYGRLLVFEGAQLDDAVDVDINTAVVNNKTLLDVPIHTLLPITILLPVTQTEGGIETSAGGTITVLLAKGKTAVAGQNFIPYLTVAGQTLLPNVDYRQPKTSHSLSTHQ